MSGVTVWQWQMVYIAHGVTGQLEGPLAEFCLGPQGGQDRHCMSVIIDSYETDLNCSQSKEN